MIAIDEGVEFTLTVPQETFPDNASFVPYGQVCHFLHTL